jgi:hypothetical protein
MTTYLYTFTVDIPDGTSRDDEIDVARKAIGDGTADIHEIIPLMFEEDQC